MPVEIPKDKWPGAVRTVTIGATAAEGGTRTHTVTVGGEQALPFMHFDAEMPHKPVIALEIKDHKPTDWSPLLLEAWGEAMDAPGTWAKAAEAAGADLLQLSLSLTDADGNPTTRRHGGNGRSSCIEFLRSTAHGFRARSGRSRQ